LQNSVPGADISVQKIIFNTDGSQIALICAYMSILSPSAIGLKNAFFGRLCRW
jgi:VanZ family protein